MMIELPDHLVNNLGRTVFTGLVMAKDDGRLMVMVPLREAEDGDDMEWLAEDLDEPEARSFAAQLEVHGAGGGTA